MCTAVACPLRKSSWTMGFRMPVTLKVYCNEHQSDGHFLLLNSQFLDTYIFTVQGGSCHNIQSDEGLTLNLEIFCINEHGVIASSEPCFILLHVLSCTIYSSSGTKHFPSHGQKIDWINPSIVSYNSFPWILIR